MPSHLHEAVLELIRNRPQIVVELLTGSLAVSLPEHARVDLHSGDFTELVPTEYRADQVVVLSDAAGRAVWAVVVESQTNRDTEKLFSWPVYVTTLRARVRCPVTLLIFCPTRAIAAWCARPIDVGLPGSGLGQLVLGPDRIPVITDPVRAAQVPELAVLAALAHGGEDYAVLDALPAAFGALDRRRAADYYDIVLAALPAAARDHLEALVATGTFEYRSDFARGYHARGKAEGEAKAVVTFLRARGIEVPEAAEAHIIGCTDLDQLTVWVQRAATVTSVDDLLTNG